MRTSSKRTTLAVLRAFLGIKTPELSEATGLSISSIEKMESGRLAISESAAEILRKTTGINKEWLLNNDTSARIMGDCELPYTMEDFKFAQTVSSELPDFIKLKRELKQAHGAGLSTGELLGEVFAAAWNQDKKTFQKVYGKVNALIRELKKEFGAAPEEYLEMRSRTTVRVSGQDGSVSELITTSPKSLRKFHVDRSMRGLDWIEETAPDVSKEDLKSARAHDYEKEHSKFKAQWHLVRAADHLKKIAEETEKTRKGPRKKSEIKAMADEIVKRVAPRR